MSLPGLAVIITRSKMNQSRNPSLGEVVIKQGLHWLIQLTSAATIYDIWLDDKL